MTTKTSNDVLADGARCVVDAESFRAWVEGPLQAALPHRAFYCGQSIAHSGGFAAIQKWSFGVPQAYLNTIECVGGNVRSPVLTRLMRSGGPEYFDLDRNEWPDIDGEWRDNFRRAGWRSLLGLALAEGEGDHLVFTSAAFYDVANDSTEDGNLHQRVMTGLHEVLSRLYGTEGRSPAHIDQLASLRLTRVELPIVRLLLQGKTNKEIGNELGKSAETVKTQLAKLMKRVGVRNRTKLARMAMPFSTDPTNDDMKSYANHPIG